jgi:response regulator RpfG family c-di-GMP phosphodiesterase
MHSERGCVAKGDAAGAADARTPAAHQSMLGIQRVLLVEDDDAVALGLAMLLELEGFSVSTGEGDSEAVKVQATAPHVGYLVKPYEIDGLLAEMQRVIARRT